ncbi:MAG: hypothetical protein V4718_06315 [Pseudomonadota bacterium]
MGWVLAAGVGAFLVLLAAQVILWRVLGVRREMLGLAVVYLLMPVFVFVAMALLTNTDLLDLILAGFLYLALACGYIQTYPALREDIPSFRILFAIDAAGPGGLSEDEIAAALGIRNLLSRKMDDLSSDRLVGVDADGKLHLLPAGRWLAIVFRTYRKTLGLQRGLG